MTADLLDCARRTHDWHFFSWYWGDAIAVDGLLRAAAAGAVESRAHVVETITRWDTHCPENLDDVLAPGRAIVDLTAAGDVPRSAAERFVAAVARLPRIDGEIPLLEPHRPVFRFGVCIDAVYHLPVALACYGRWHADATVVRSAVQMANSCMRRLACPGGWAQWYDAARGENNGAVWTRGLGWALLGLLDLIEVAEDAAAVEECRDTASEIMALLSDSIGPDGTWPGILGHPGAQHETSTSAFFVAAAHHPSLDPAAKPDAASVAQALSAVTSALADDGTFTGVSTDVLPSFDRSTYARFACEPSPWAQGAALRALSVGSVPGAAGRAPGGRESVRRPEPSQRGRKPTRS